MESWIDGSIRAGRVLYGYSGGVRGTIHCLIVWYRLFGSMASREHSYGICIRQRIEYI